MSQISLSACLKRVSSTSPSYPHLPVLITLPSAPGTKLLLGRGQDCDVLLTSNRYPAVISRSHCEIVLDPQTNKHVLTDPNSKNGTYVNNTRVASQILVDCDLITFGGADTIKIGDIFFQPDSEFIYQYFMDASSIAVSLSELKRAPISGHNADLFLDLSENQLDFYQCSICTEICREAVQTNNGDQQYNDEPCGHNFCSVCIKNALIYRQTCPKCNRSLTISQIMPDAKLRRAIGSLKVKCSNFDNNNNGTSNNSTYDSKANDASGCTWTGEFGKEGDGLAKHVTTLCEFETIKCTYVGCHFTNRRGLMPKHTIVCRYQGYNCIYCGSMMQLAQKDSHEKTCLLYPLSCPLQCEISLPRQSIQFHLDNNCYKQIVNCRWQKNECKFQGERGKIDEHEEDCKHREIQCEYCSVTLPSHQKQKHEDFHCKRLLVACPARCKFEKIAREDIDAHIKNDCPNTTVSCEFNYAGCSSTFERKKKVNHDQEFSQQHVSLLSRYIYKHITRKPKHQEFIKCDYNVYGCKKTFLNAKSLLIHIIQNIKVHSLLILRAFQTVPDTFTSKNEILNEADIHFAMNTFDYDHMYAGQLVDAGFETTDDGFMFLPAMIIYDENDDFILDWIIDSDNSADGFSSTEISEYYLAARGTACLLATKNAYHVFGSVFHRNLLSADTNKITGAIDQLNQLYNQAGCNQTSNALIISPAIYVELEPDNNYHNNRYDNNDNNINNNGNNRSSE